MPSIRISRLAILVLILIGIVGAYLTYWFLSLPQYPVIVETSSFSCNDTHLKTALVTHRDDFIAKVVSHSLFYVTENGEMVLIVGLPAKPNSQMVVTPTNVDIPVRTSGSIDAEPYFLGQIGKKYYYKDGDKNSGDVTNGVFTVEEFDRITNCVEEHKEHLVTLGLPQNIFWLYSGDIAERQVRAFGEINPYGTYLFSGEMDDVLFNAGNWGILIRENHGPTERIDGVAVNFFTLNPKDEDNPLTIRYGEEIWNATNKDNVTFEEFLINAQIEWGVSFK